MGDFKHDMWDVDDEALVCIDLDYKEIKGSKFTLDCDRLLETKGSPLLRYRPRYLMVTDFMKQHWCEQQLLYDLSPEVILLRALPGVTVNIQESAAAKEVKGKGSNIHQARELEIQVPVEVKVVTKEDRWAVKFLNLQAAVLTFHAGHRVAREVPVFGMPFGYGLFVFGIIDELQYDPANHSIQISELKTRRSRCVPKKSQQEKDKYQVGLYAQLFNELVQGKVSADMLGTHLNLKVDTPLSDGVRKHIVVQDSAINQETWTLRCLLNMVLTQVQSLTCISRAKIEYVHQESKTQISLSQLELDVDIVQLQFARQCEWWQGERGTVGVDVEDCWKCGFCQYSALCEWREVMAREMSKKSIKR